jgi:hypothetical protein
MVRKVLLAVVFMVGLVAVPRPVLAGCTTTLSDCMVAAAKVDSAWYRFAAGLDCELDYVECVRVKLIGV